MPAPGRRLHAAGATATIGAGVGLPSTQCPECTVSTLPPTSLHPLDAPQHPGGRTPLSPPNPVALRLGYLGLLPFVLGALLSLLVREEAHPYVVLALAGYAAVIISFLGGIHWGLGMRASVPSPTPFAWAVVPSLLAWVAVVMPAYAGLVIDGLLLIVCYLVDRRSYPAHGLSAWLTLRFRLTVVATLSCFVAAARI